MDKKSITMLVLLFTGLLPAAFVQAQTFDEWWFQKKTQIKYLGLQIAALQVYAGYLEKGYSIVQQGTSFINDLKRGEFDLHKDYFSSLRIPSPAVKNYSRVKEIVQLEEETMEVRERSLSLIRSANNLAPPLADAATATLSGILQRCTQQAVVLQTLITADQLQLTEADRITRINELYAGSRKLYRFVLEVFNSTSTLVLQHQKERTDGQQAAALYGLP
jgi:hypothetical protein